MKSAIILLISCLVFVLDTSAQQSKYALVVGNADYRYLETLGNPVNDSNDIASLLSKIGFDVDAYSNLTKDSFVEAVKGFNRKSKNYDVVLFYYAGHGLEIGEKNYFVPIDAIATSISEVKKSCVSANSIIYSIKSLDSDANIIILDACRNNPFTLIDPSEAGDGLALMDAPSGTLIAFSTAPGKVASDGTGRNGLYTDALLTHLGSFDEEINDVFASVRNTIVRKTGENQVPWESTSLTQEIILNPKPEVPLELTILEGNSITFEGKGNLHAVSNLQGVSFNWYYQGKQFTNGSIIEVKKTGTYQLKAVSRQGQILLSDPISVTVKSFVKPKLYIQEGDNISFNERGKIHGKSNVLGEFNWLKGNNVVAKGPELEVEIPGSYRFQVVTRDGETAISDPINVRIK